LESRKNTARVAKKTKTENSKKQNKIGRIAKKRKKNQRIAKTKQKQGE
jgi:hypothetical protein